MTLRLRLRCAWLRLCCAWLRLRAWLRLCRAWLRLCCAWLRLRARRFHSTLLHSCLRNILTTARRLLNDLRLARYLRPGLLLSSLRNVLPSAGRRLLRFLAMSDGFAASLLHSTPLRALLLDLLLLLLRRSTLSLLAVKICLALLLLQILQLSPGISVPLAASGAN